MVPFGGMRRSANYICKKSLSNAAMIKVIPESKTIAIKLVNTEVQLCNLKYSIPKEVLMVFHIGLNYDYHFIIKEIAKTFEEEFNCLGENTKKYKIFSVPIAKEATRIDQNGKEIMKTMSYKLQLIESARFMVSSLSNLVDNLAKGIHKIKCKY